MELFKEKFEELKKSFLKKNPSEKFEYLYDKVIDLENEKLDISEYNEYYHEENEEIPKEIEKIKYEQSCIFDNIDDIKMEMKEMDKAINFADDRIEELDEKVDKIMKILKINGGSNISGNV